MGEKLLTWRLCNLIDYEGIVESEERERYYEYLSLYLTFVFQLVDTVWGGLKQDDFWKELRHWGRP